LHNRSAINNKGLKPEAAVCCRKPLQKEYSGSIARIGFDVEGFAQAYSTAVRVTPKRWQVW